MEITLGMSEWRNNRNDSASIRRTTNMKNIVRSTTRATVLGLLLCFYVEQAPAQASGSPVSTMGSRGTVTPTATMYGGFTISQTTNVIIVVRGQSLVTLGATSNGLTNPSLRLYNSIGQDLLTNTTGGNFVNVCPATQTTAIYYLTRRGQALDATDSCINPRVLAPGSYTFSITPSPNGDTSGEVLFEATFNPNL